MSFGLTHEQNVWDYLDNHSKEQDLFDQRIELYKKLEEDGSLNWAQLYEELEHEVHLEYEVHGIIDLNDQGQLEVVTIVNGEQRSCDTSKMVKTTLGLFAFHTHPIGVRPTPSGIDVSNVITYDCGGMFLGELLFSSYGICKIQVNQMAMNIWRKIERHSDRATQMYFWRRGIVKESYDLCSRRAWTWSQIQTLWKLRNVDAFFIHQTREYQNDMKDHVMNLQDSGPSPSYQEYLDMFENELQKLDRKRE